MSTQAAYAAPLILLAQKRQAERDKDAGEQAEAHHEELARRTNRRRLYTYYPDEGPLRRELYPKHQAFLAAGMLKMRRHAPGIAGAGVPVAAARLKR